MCQIGAKELKEIPIWKGNRILDEAHAQEIYKGVGGNVKWLDSSIFRIVKYSEMNASGALVEQKYIIDGQHRAWCIKKFFDSDTVCEPDFEVFIIEKTVEDETEAIEYFNSLNNVKAQHWKQDPAILANAYIAALEKKFKNKHKLIRPGVTKRPYLAAEKLRDALKESSALLKPGAENIGRFVDAVVAWNTKELKALEMRMIVAEEKDKGIMENCIDKKFALAFDPRLKWVKDCLVAT
jgi:hypothetical protein